MNVDENNFEIDAELLATLTLINANKQPKLQCTSFIICFALVKRQKVTSLQLPHIPLQLKKFPHMFQVPKLIATF